MNLPRLLIASLEKGKAKEIATSIGAERLSNQDYFQRSTDNNLEYYLWKIQNKYYSTHVLVCITENPSPDIVVDGIEALILHHDPQADNAEQNLKQWSSLIASLAEADVLLFSCDCITDALIRDKVIQWCLQKKFELIELNRSDVDISEADSEHNKHGVERVVEALHAHMWSTMTLKEKPSSAEEQSSEVKGVEEQFENIKLAQNSTERLPMENMLDGIMGEENADFGEFFSQLMAMKEYAASLPTNQRRIAAEQVVTAFWKAMGGDSSETED